MMAAAIRLNPGIGQGIFLLSEQNHFRGEAKSSPDSHPPSRLKRSARDWRPVCGGGRGQGE
jgi:hypothetical protein